MILKNAEGEKMSRMYIKRALDKKMHCLVKKMK